MAQSGQSAKAIKKATDAKPKASVKKLVKDAAINTAMVVGPGKFLKGAQIAKAGIAAARGTGAAKKLTTAEKAMVKDVKSVAKNAKPGSVQKMMDKLPLEQKRAYSQALRKAIPDSKKAAVYKPTKQAKPLKSVKRTTEPINKRTTEPIKKSSRTDAILEQQYAKAVKATKAVGGDPKKVKLTYNGRTIDYNGIR
jgi:hypothetical protein